MLTFLKYIKNVFLNTNKNTFKNTIYKKIIKKYIHLLRSTQDS